MNQCARCGAELRANSKWCLACGEHVGESAERFHSAPTEEFEYSPADETITEAGAQRVPTISEDLHPPASALPTLVEARPLLEARPAVDAVTLVEQKTVVEPLPGEPPPTEPELGKDTIAATVPVPSAAPGAPVDRSETMEFFPQEPSALPTLQQSRPATAAKVRKPVPLALILLPLLFVVAVGSAAAYYVLTREPSRKTEAAPVPEITRKAPVKPAPAQPAAIESVTQSLEIQGPPAPQPELEVPSPVPPKDENRKVTSPKNSRGSKKKTTSPEPDPVPEAEPAPEEPQPVDPMAVVEPGPGVTSAELVYRAPLRLPLRARIRRVRGRASVEVIVKTDGNPESPALVESSGNEIFDRAAMSAAMRCRFTPGIRDGERVRTRARIDYSNVSSEP